MTLENLKASIINSLCKEFQSLWLIDMKDLSMITFWSDESKAIPNSVSSAKNMGTLDKVREWYINKYVVEQQRDRVFKQTTIEMILKMTSGGEPYCVGYARRFEGKINYNQFCFDRILDDSGAVAYILLGMRDIDERKKADVDDVTGLLTRPAFFERAEALLKHNPDTQFDIVISDIMDFKKVNETYGIEKADEILNWIGSFLSPCSGEDLIIGRYGSDQMVLLGCHEEINKYSIKDGAERFLEAEKNNGLPSVIMKFGVYENIRHDIPVVSSCDKAHIALNNIKGHYEKSMAFYDDELERKLVMQRRIESSMYDSLENNNFKVYYQPKHDSITGKLTGAEALIRWDHPEYGFMSPNDFIPLFEFNGYVVEIDNFVWKRTCENLRRWKEMGLDTVPISVNASKLTFEQDDLIKKLQAPVLKNHISPKQLHIEITETLMTDDVDDLIMKLTALRAIGYEIELDDFGAGYSSINILSTLPIDVVKLDMSFMKQFGNEKRTKVLAACINLARELGYKTVSEGVERQEQLEILGILGVDSIQGYLYSHPLSEEEFEEYMKAQKE